jgi:hypothetical protein
MVRDGRRGGGGQPILGSYTGETLRARPHYLYQWLAVALRVTVSFFYHWN